MRVKVRGPLGRAGRLEPGGLRELDNALLGGTAPALGLTTGSDTIREGKGRGPAMRCAGAADGPDCICVRTGGTDTGGGVIGAGGGSGTAIGGGRFRL